MTNQLKNQLTFERLSGQVNYMIDLLGPLGIPETVLEPNIVKGCAGKSKN